MNDFNHNVVQIIQHKRIYTFSLTEIMNIIVSSIANTSYFFSEPKTCKNPYTNLPFDKSSLYNIYFKVRSSSLLMNPLFHAFFISNFDIEEYQTVNEYIIREYSIKHYINKSPTGVLYPLVFDMITVMKFTKYIKIHKEFPKDKLVEIMKPYLYLFYLYEYSLDNSRRDVAYDQLVVKLTKFTEYNPDFGKKIITKTQSKNPFLNEDCDDIITFNDKCCNFYSKNKTTNLFTINHLNMAHLLSVTPSLRYPSDHNEPLPPNENYDEDEDDDDEDNISDNNSNREIMHNDHNDDDDDDDEFNYNDERYA